MTRQILIIFLLFFIPSATFAQDIRFIQRFSWKADPAALEYRVEVQNTQSGKTERVTTRESFAEFSLAAGTYRYRVSVYNILGKLSSVGDWKPFTVSASPLPKDGDEFTQTLSWQGGGAASYRVELENTETGERGIFATSQTSARLSLSAGRYRYRVTAFDMLGRSGTPSDWVSFEVFKANKPEIKHIEEIIVQPDGGKVALGVDITNITEGSTVELVRESEEGSFAEDGISARGKAGNETGNADTVYFENVGVGTWRLRVTNPSGLSTESEPFEIQGAPEPPPPHATADDSPTDDGGRRYRSITVFAGLGLWFSPYDGALLGRNNVTYFGQSLIPALVAGVQVLPFSAGRERHDRWGFALSLDGTRLFYRNDAYNQKTTTGTVNALAVYHRPLASDMLYAAFMAGGGVAMIQSAVSYKAESGVNIDIGYSSNVRGAARSLGGSGTGSTDSPEDGTSFHPCICAGLSLVWVPFTRFCVELGANFTHIFAHDIPTGIATPYFTLGLRL